MVKTKALKITKDLIGRYVRISFTDVGCVDGICVDVNSKDKTLSFFSPIDNTIDEWAEIGQLVEIGPYLEIPKF